jgi:hypothetical protein
LTNHRLFSELKSDETPEPQTLFFSRFSFDSGYHMVGPTFLLMMDRAICTPLTKQELIPTPAHFTLG